MDQTLLGWLTSLSSLLVLALLLHLWQRPERWGPRLGAGLLILLCLLGFHWIFISLHRYGEMPAAVAAIATFLLALYVAAYGIFAGWLIRRHRLSPLSVAGLITLLEWLRGELFTGFPWLNWGYQQIDSPLSGYAALGGVYAVVLITALCAAWIAQWRALGLMGVAGLHLLGVYLGTLAHTSPEGQPIQVALVQSAVPQQMKFDPAHSAQLEAAQLEMALAASRTGSALVVLPETAFIRPWSALSAETRLRLREISVASGSVIILGLPLQDPDGWRNSAIGLYPGAGLRLDGFESRYDKAHLVPFGEFIPWGFRWFVNLMNMPLGDFTRGLPVQAPMPVEGQRIGVNICFEDLFGEEIIGPLDPRIAPERQPTILLNMSNLAWFGNTSALPQHLAIARMRSLETGRPSIRATNTGMTASIDHRGRVQEVLPPMAPGVLVARVQGMTGQTPYSRVGNLPVVLLAAALLLLGLRVRSTAKMRP
ncbi:MAG: apolipoprotein N-acyltransferase [Burkholderiaceae bacterium]|jgi:apolipoprotein N-acyltransferase